MLNVHKIFSNLSFPSESNKTKNKSALDKFSDIKNQKKT